MVAQVQSADAGVVVRTSALSVERDGLRSDIQGLRGVAVLLVVVYHYWPALLPGGYVGVDVFFLLSGFLITRLLLIEVDRSGKIDLGRFYERRMRRLLPAASLVLVLTAACTLWLLPASDWNRIGADTIASTLYVQNWWLAAAAVDYLGAGGNPSPLQHFWSLSVEEQFYFVWPALLALVAFGWRSPARGAALLVLMLGFTLSSLAWSVWHTLQEPSVAYFVSTTRAWELGAGGVLAFWHRASPPRWLRFVLAPSGLAAILLASLLYSDETRFPGFAALLPVLGASAIILAGMNGAPGGFGRWMQAGPLVYLGGISYSFYLWHWPLLVLAGTERSADGGIGLLALFALAIVLSDLSKRFVEDRFRHPAAGEDAKRRRTWSLVVTCMTLSLLAGAALQFAAERSAARELATFDSSGTGPVGALAIGAPPLLRAEGRAFAPPLATARKDIAEVYRLGCHGNESKTEPVRCEFGALRSGRILAVAGDSHAAQWIPALSLLAERNGWRLHAYTKSGCPFSPETTFLRGQPYQACSEWNRRLLELLRNEPPDVLVTSQYVGHLVVGSKGRPDSAERFARGLVESWSSLQAAGTIVVAIRDTPRIGFDVVDCMAGADGDFESCALPRSEAFSYPDPVLKAAGLNSGVVLVDLSDHICHVDKCRPVVGDTLVYRDPNHLTATYVRTLAPVLEELLRPLLAPE